MEYPILRSYSKFNRNIWEFQSISFRILEDRTGRIRIRQIKNLECKTNEIVRFVFGGTPWLIRRQKVYIENIREEMNVDRKMYPKTISVIYYGLLCGSTVYGNNEIRYAHLNQKVFRSEGNINHAASIPLAIISL